MFETADICTPGSLGSIFEKQGAGCIVLAADTSTRFFVQSCVRQVKRCFGQIAFEFVQHPIIYIKPGMGFFLQIRIHLVFVKLFLRLFRKFADFQGIGHREGVFVKEVQFR